MAIPVVRLCGLSISSLGYRASARFSLRVRSAHSTAFPKMKILVHTFFLLPRWSSNHAMERTATRRGFTLFITSTSSLQAARGFGGRRSSYSR
jgi:hypothetical protein